VAPINQGSSPIDIDIETLKKRKYVISGTSIAAFVVAVWWGHGWVGVHLDRYLVTEVEAQSIGQQVQQAARAATEAASAAESVGRTLDAYIKRQDLKDSRERLNLLNQQLGETQLWEAANGPNDITRARRADLSAQIVVTQNYIRCLEAGRPDCALL
jgi:hypothetical protein